MSFAKYLSVLPSADSKAYTEQRASKSKSSCSQSSGFGDNRENAHEADKLSRMLIDSFLIFDEIDLAIFRIEYLSEFVDKIVIAESTLTHSGELKPLYFQEALSQGLISRAHDIEVLNLDLSDFSDSWSREIASREKLIDHIVKKFPHTRFINSDVDEIPSLQSVELFLNSPIGNYHFRTQTYYRYANWALLDSHANWNRGVFGYSESPFPRNGGRFTKLPTVNAPEKGAHLSYVGRKAQSISRKLESFAHVELNKQYLKSREYIEFVDRYAVDHLGRSRNLGFGILKIIPEKEFTSIHRKLYEDHQDFFRFLPRKPSIVTRFLASITCSIIANDRIGYDSVYSLLFDKKPRCKVLIFGVMSLGVEVMISVLLYGIRSLRSACNLFIGKLQQFSRWR